MGGTMLVRGPLQAHQFGTRNAFCRRETAGNVPQKNGTEFAVPPVEWRIRKTTMRRTLVVFILALIATATIATAIKAYAVESVISQQSHIVCAVANALAHKAEGAYPVMGED